MHTLARRLPVLLVAFGLLVLPIAADDKDPPKVEKTKASAGKAAISDLLAKRVSVEKFDGKFDDAVKMLREKYDLPLVLDPSLRSEADAPIPDNVQVPKLVNVRLGTILRLVSDQGNAMFLVEPDHIRIVSSMHGLIEAGVWSFKQSVPFEDNVEESPLPLTDRRKYQPAIFRSLVNASFTGKPVSEIVDAIAESTGATVVLAPQAAEKAKQAITVRFTNTPVDAAIRTICEMAELGAIEDTNVLIVTSKERAAEKAAARAKVLEQKERTWLLVQAARPFFGGTGIPVAPEAAARLVANVADEMAKLKEQNEQLKKQLDEIQKQLKK